MKSDDFIKALEQFSSLDPNQAIQTLYGLFKSIHHLDTKDLCAAKDTIDFYSSIADLDENQQKLVDRLVEACCSKARTGISHYHMLTSENVCREFGFSFSVKDLRGA